MNTQVYTLHIAYEGLESKIWRTVEISGNNTVAQLGYLILASFDTLAYHAFEITCNNIPYALPMMMEEESTGGTFDATKIQLNGINLQEGDMLSMEYDFGCSQIFKIQVIHITGMAKGTGRKYPRVIDGGGRGILDDVHVDELSDYIAQIDESGKSQIYIIRNEREEIWDYRTFNLNHHNALLKAEIEEIQNAYENPF